MSKVSFYWGYTQFKGFGLGFHIDKWTFTIDLGPFWFGMEW